MELTRRGFITVLGATASAAILPTLPVAATPTVNSITVGGVEKGSHVAVFIANTMEQIYSGVAVNRDIKIKHSLPEGIDLVFRARCPGFQNLQLPFDTSSDHNITVYHPQDLIFT